MRTSRLLNRLAEAGRQSADAWKPLRTPIFRTLFVADLLSDMGTFMQTVGAAWLMVSFGASPTLIALTQTASSLPFFVFALPAGALGDIVDRRALILWCEAWMIGAACVLAVATIAGVMSPWLLLVLTFCISAGDAIETPTWRAILPELVGPSQLAAASALNGIEFNFARAVGPALAGGLIAFAGVSAAFVANVFSFVGVVIVVARWKRPVRTRSSPFETLGGATVAAVRYVRYAPELRFIMVRAAITMAAASALLALLPGIARTLGGEASVYGLLLGCFGGGAVLGGLLMAPARAQWSLETVATGAVLVLGAAIGVAGAVRHPIALAAVIVVAGAGWIVFISLISAIVQGLAPDWARARVLAVFILAFQGGLAAGGVLWGLLATRFGYGPALIAAGLATAATTTLGAVWKLPDVARDLTPWNHWKLPTFPDHTTPALDEGPVLVSVRYQVVKGREAKFLHAMQRAGRIRRRDGAFWWGIFRDVEKPEVYTETFLVSSWAEHARQHERFTQADREVEAEINRQIEGEPETRHLLYAQT